MNLIKENSSEISTDFLVKSENGVSTSNMTEKLTYEDIFYRRYKEGRKEGRKVKRVRICDTPQHLLPRRTQEYTASQCNEGIGVNQASSHPYGFPISIGRGQWCQQLKLFSESPTNEGRKINIIQYLGIAPDEPLRVAKHIGRKDVILPLVEIGWEEGLCGLIAKYQDLLSPTYTTSMRGGCWFCHNQSVGQLRLLRKNYPDLWQLLLKWDKDSPVTFHADGHTVHDFDRRFAMEDEGIAPTDRTFRWEMLNADVQQMRFLF